MREYLLSIHKSALRFLNRIEKFHVYTNLRININSKEQDNESYSFNPMAAKLQEKMKSIFEIRGRIKDISISIASGNISIKDIDFEIIALELLSNACKFSEKGTNISISGILKDEKYELIVSNVGEGLNWGCFEDFEQKEREYHQQQGNGLGLPIVKMIADKYKLKIDIDENPVTKVTITFPLASSD